MFAGECDISPGGCETFVVDSPVCKEICCESSVSDVGGIGEIPGPVCERLKNCLSFWQAIDAGSFVLRVIRNGYVLPFVALPPPKFMHNSGSSVVHKAFVSESIDELLHAGSIAEVDKSSLVVCSPLHVVDNGKKLRLIVDLPAM